MATSSAKCPRCGHTLQFDENTTEPIVCGNCQATLNPPKRAKSAAQADPLLGKTLGEFEILEILGRGGMATVYRARQPSLDRLVALKVLTTAQADPDFVRRFAREARAAAAVNHAHIIQIFAVGEHAGHHYIAMELVGGGNLAQLVRAEGALAPERALRLMKQTTAALANAHAANILHRDIKPSNILLTPDGAAKIADFGLAKRAEGDVAVTMVGKVVGTMLYMAPEVAAGKAADARSDLYSLGATFYHVLAGAPPFAGSSPTELAVKHTQASVPPLAERAPGAPPPLCRLIHRLLRKNPAERYPSAEELLAAIERVEARLGAPHDEPSSAVHDRLHPSRAGRAQARGGQRRKLALIGGLGGAAAVLLILLILALTGGKKTPDTQGRVGPDTPPPAEVAKKKATPRARAQLWAEHADKMEGQVLSLVAQQRYGKAIGIYDDIARRCGDAALARKLAAKATEIRSQAAAAYRKTEQRATDLLEEKKFDDARTVLLPVIEQFGTRDEVDRARRLLERIENAEDAHYAATEKAKPPPKKKDEAKAEPKAKAKPPPKEIEAAAKARAEAEKRRQAEERYAKALQPVEALIKAWAFTKASEALAQLDFEQTHLAERLATRRAEVELLAGLKAKMIAKINHAQPKLRKSALLIRGLNGDLIEADETQVRAKLPNGVVEGHPWKGLAAKSARRLAQLATDRDDADDCVASGLLALVCNDAAAAAADFEKARTLGASVDRYFASIVAAAFDQASALIKKGDFAEAGKALDAIEKKYGKTAWFTERKSAIEGARRRIQSEGAEAAAQKLYQKAVALYKKKDYFSLKPIVQKLTAQYADTRAVTDETRKPSVVDMEAVTARLGKILTVRKKGDADFKTIQAAIDAAPPRSIILIREGRYGERLYIPEEKEGLILKGKPGAWPIVGAAIGGSRVVRRLLDINASDVTLDGIIFAFVGSSDSSSRGCISVEGAERLRIRYCILSTGSRYSGTIISNYGGLTEMDHCLIVNSGSISGNLHARNTISLGRYLNSYSSSYSTTRRLRVGEKDDGKDDETASAVRGSKLVNCAMYKFDTSGPCHIEHCTFPGGLDLGGEPNVVRDSILESVEASKHNTRIDYCDVFGKKPFIEFAKPGKKCTGKNPMLVNAKGFDYRLMSDSPCRKRASDGKDLGCRYTKGMRDLLKLAFALRSKGIIQFSPIRSRRSYYE